MVSIYADRNSNNTHGKIQQCNVYGEATFTQIWEKYKINKSINVFQWKTQNVQFRNICKHILLFTYYTYDKRDNEDQWFFWITFLKINEINAVVV